MLRRPLLRSFSSPLRLGVMACIILLVITGIFLTVLLTQRRELADATSEQAVLTEALASTSAQLNELLNQDQYKINQDLKSEILSIQKTYKKAVVTYENLLKVKEISKNVKGFDAQFAKTLTLLSEKNYASAEAELTDLSKKIQTETDKVSSSFSIPANVPAKNTPPGSGFSRQQVDAGIGTYLVDIVSADLGSTRVIVDTASDGTCANNCPVLSLGDYVSRSGGFAGINGSYFCPESYPSCAGKTNSFDTLLMNKNKVYFNSDNNVYSNVPAVIFLGGSIRFVGRSLEWGRDTGVDGVIANQPLLLSGGNITFGGDGDPKKGSKGSRSFVGNKGNTVYIGVVHNATVAEVAHVLKTLGLENALNLDSGGSTALWSGGYKVGPGRNIPNAIIFVRK
ncbi:MAG: hypothetical protein RLZZ455_1008 [Candidatus Parcubacteria bacterium]